MKTTLTALLVLFAAFGARAQTPIKVAVGGYGYGTQRVVDRLKSKIGGTSRYAVSEDTSAAYVNIPGEITSCSADGERCAEFLFENFVKNTQPEKLAAAKSKLQRSVDQYVRLRQP